MRLYRFPHSTNVERVSLALAYKGLSVESIHVDPEDRTLAEKVSGQRLVPILEDGKTIICDSTAILRYLESKHPDPPLFPSDPARAAEMDLFLDWFNQAWKRPPNKIYLEMNRSEPDPLAIARVGRIMTAYLDLFERMLTGREYLMGDFSVADVVAFPFLKYSILQEENDPYLFHRILSDHQPLGQEHPRLENWIRRMDTRPRV